MAAPSSARADTRLHPQGSAEFVNMAENLAKTKKPGAVSGAGLEDASLRGC